MVLIKKSTGTTFPLPVMMIWFQFRFICFHEEASQSILSLLPLLKHCTHGHNVSNINVMLTVQCPWL